MFWNLQAHSEAQKVAIRFERACSMHEAAKEMVQLAEQGYMKGEASTDPAWQEMLNHATMKVYFCYNTQYFIPETKDENHNY